MCRRVEEFVGMIDSFQRLSVGGVSYQRPVQSDESHWHEPVGCQQRDTVAPTCTRRRGKAQQNAVSSSRFKENLFFWSICRGWSGVIVRLKGGTVPSKKKSWIKDKICFSSPLSRWEIFCHFHVFVFFLLLLSIETQLAENTGLLRHRDPSQLNSASHSAVRGKLRENVTLVKPRFWNLATLLSVSQTAVEQCNRV